MSVLPLASLPLRVLCCVTALHPIIRATCQAVSARDKIAEHVGGFFFSIKNSLSCNPMISSINQPGYCKGDFYWKR